MLHLVLEARQCAIHRSVSLASFTRITRHPFLASPRCTISTSWFWLNTASSLFNQINHNRAHITENKHQGTKPCIIQAVIRRRLGRVHGIESRRCTHLCLESRRCTHRGSNCSRKTRIRKVVFACTLYRKRSGFCLHKKPCVIQAVIRRRLGRVHGIKSRRCTHLCLESRRCTPLVFVQSKQSQPCKHQGKQESGNKAVHKLKENNVVFSRNNEQHPFLCE